MSDFRHYFTWILPWIWGLCNSAIKANCRVICWICEVKTHSPANEVSHYPVFWFLFSESYAASFQADRVRGNRSAVLPVHPAIVGYLYHCFYWSDIERLKRKKKNEPLGINCAILVGDKHSNGPLFFDDVIYDLVSNVLTFQTCPHIYILSKRTCVLSI